MNSYTFYDSGQYFKVGIVVFLFVLGLVSLLLSSRHIVFDRQKGFYHKGLKSLANNLPKEGSNCTRLENIHAIQLISEIVRRRNSRFRSYELNLVLKSGKRINVIDHSNQESVRKDADLVGRFLNVSVLGCNYLTFYLKSVFLIKMN